MATAATSVRTRWSSPRTVRRSGRGSSTPARVHLPVGGLLPGEARWRQMRDNLLEALRNERLLLVFDNFETQLEGVARGDGCYACADPEWDRLLGHLAEGGSRRGAAAPAPGPPPNPVYLARALVGGLDIATQATLALERWDACLDLLTESEETQQAMGEGAHSLARTRLNRHKPLLNLGRFDEAQEVLESCLAVFRGVS